jgi:hypothetical protein
MMWRRGDQEHAAEIQRVLQLSEAEAAANYQQTLAEYERRLARYKRTLRWVMQFASVVTLYNGCITAIQLGVGAWETALWQLIPTFGALAFLVWCVIQHRKTYDTEGT